MSEFNPADVASCSINLLHDGKHWVRLWLNGPHFLCHQECWPKNPNIKVYTDVPLVALQDNIPPPVHTSEVVGVSSMPLKQDENTISKITLTLMAEVIHKHSMLQALCRDVVTLIVFVEYMFLCREEKIYVDCPDWENQKFRVKTKFIKLRDGNNALNITDIECAEILIAQYVQSSHYGPIYKKRSCDATQYKQAISNVHDTNLKDKLK